MFEKYAAEEPQMVTAYVDLDGNYHPTRDQAIAANVKGDISAAIMDAIAEDVNLHNLPVRPLDSLVRRFIHSNKDLVRVMIGDREAT